VRGSNLVAGYTSPATLSTLRGCYRRLTQFSQHASARRPFPTRRQKADKTRALNREKARSNCRMAA